MVKGFKNFKKFIAIAVGVSIALPMFGTLSKKADAAGYTLTVNRLNNSNGIGLKWTVKSDSVYKLVRSEDGGSYLPVGDYNGVMPLEKRTINVLPIMPRAKKNTQSKISTNFLHRWLDDSRTNNLNINVLDAVSFETFNNAGQDGQNKYLYKDVKGSKYGVNVDVIFFGAADGYEQPDLSETAKSTIAYYIKEHKGGVIYAHDTIALGEWHDDWDNDSWNNFWKLSYSGANNSAGIDFLKPYFGYAKNNDVYSDSNQQLKSNYSNRVSMTKLGLLTSYPINFDPYSQFASGNSVKYIVGTSHNTGQAVHDVGDIWFKFADSARPSDGTETNFFLTTHEHMGMIQTGHSVDYNGYGVTNEEMCMTANLIYYVAYLNSVDTYEDKTATDKGKPIVNAKVTSATKGKAAISIQSTDTGTTYSYYVYEYPRDADIRTINALTDYETHRQPVEMKTGLKACYYMVDENEEAVPNNPNFVEMTTFDKNDGTATIDYSILQSNRWLHIYTVDNAGNKSDVKNILIGKDESAPIVKIGDTIVDKNTVIDTQSQSKDSTKSDFDNLLVDDSGRKDKKNDLESGIMGYGLSKTKTDEPTSYVDNKDDVDLKSLGSGIRWLWIKDNAGNITKVKIRIHSDLFYVDSNGVRYEINEVQYVTEDGTTDMQEYYYGDKDTRIFY